MSKYIKIKNIVRITIAVFMILYFGLLATFHIQYFQERISAFISTELSQYLRTKVQIERVELGLFNRIILMNTSVEDREHNKAISFSRLSAKFDIPSIIKGKVRINSTQLFGLNASLNKKDINSPLNIQFLLDALSSEKKKKGETPIDLQINTILIRRGSIKYDLISAKKNQNKIDINHLSFYNFSATVSLQKLTNDTISMSIRRMSINEHSGLQLKRLSFSINANKEKLQIKDIDIKLPSSQIQIDSLVVQYNFNKRLKQTLSTIHAKATIKSRLVMDDLSFIEPKFKHINSPILITAQLRYEPHKLLVNKLHISNDMRGMNIRTHGYITFPQTITSPDFFIQFQEAQIGSKAIERAYTALSQNQQMPDILQRLSNITFSGNLSGNKQQLTIKGLLSSAIGFLQTQVTMLQDNVNNDKTFSGHLSTEKLDIGKLLNDSKFGSTSFNIEFKGLTHTSKQIQTHISGNISSFTYNKYEYKNISLNGKVQNDGFNGHILLNDPNGNIQINGHFLTKGHIPDFNLNISVNHLNPDRLNISHQWKDTDFSFRLKADFNGHNIDDMQGIIRLDSLIMQSSQKEDYYLLPYIYVQASHNTNQNQRLSVYSPFLQGEVTGSYSYQTLLKSLQHTVQRYLPDLFTNTTENFNTSNNFKFNFKLQPTDFFNRVLGIPLNLESDAELYGFIDDKSRDLQVKGYLRAFKYKDTHYESSSILCNNHGDQISFMLRSAMLLKQGSMLNFTLAANGKENTLHTTFNWGNNTSTTYSGKIEAMTQFSRDKNRQLYTSIQVLPSEIVLNDTVWKVHPSDITINNNKVSINHFLFEHGEQHLRINGEFGNSPSDSCVADLHDINIKYVMSILRFHAVDFAGQASGHVILHGNLKHPHMNTSLHINEFSINNAILGNAEIKGHWDENIEGIQLKAQILQKPDNFITQVEGYVSPQQKSLDLLINANGTNIAFLQPFVQDILSNIGGRGYGQVRLFGPFDSLDLDGQIRAVADMRVNILHTAFSASSDSILFKPGLITFNTVNLRDEDGHIGTASGEIVHNKLKNMQYNFKFNSRNLLVYHTNNATTEIPFYGKIYADGNLQLRGQDNLLLIDGQMRMTDNTTFTYVLGGLTQATNNSFITFVNKSPKIRQDVESPNVYHYLNQLSLTNKNDRENDIHINLQLEPTQQAQMRIIMDPIAGDNISGTGTGNLHLTYFNKGKLEIFGNYEITQGIYKMSLQNVIRRDFSIRQGSTVSFNGDPTQATLNVQAAYTVNSASLNDLITTANNKSTIKVNCLLNITGDLTAPNLNFDLDLPTVNEEDRQLVRSLTSTKEQMNTQIIYLLSLGRFYPYDPQSASNQTSTTTSLALTTLSGQLNDFLSTALNNPNWNLGTDFRSGLNGVQDIEAQAILSGRLLNNRLTINGNFGYKENSLKNTNFVGDFEAIWTLTRNGNFRIRGYNQTNDRYFTKSTLTTQGIGLMYKKDFTEWTEFFRLFRKGKTASPNDTINYKR